MKQPKKKNSSKGRKLWTSSPQTFRRLMSVLHQNTCPEGKEPFVSYEGLEQLHRFIFIMAVTHVSYSCLTMLLAIVKSREYFLGSAGYIVGENGRTKLIWIGMMHSQGQFYSRKAREADETSAQKLIETRPEDEMLLDISTLELKEAIKLLKLHLSNLAGILTFRYLKVSVRDDGGENKKKRLALKLLERESIPCTEAENGKTSDSTR